MGGRGTFAAGKNVPYEYETIGKIGDIKILSGLGSKHKLPEEAHSSYAYARLNPDGTIREIRFYDKEHFVRLEIANHREANLDSKATAVLHYHTYSGDFKREPAKRLTRAMKKRYGYLFERSWL